MRLLFEYRFSSGNGLSGHNFGNLLLSALTEVTGNTITALEVASQMLGVQGQVLPVTLTRSSLMARLNDGTELARESAIDLRRENLNNKIDYICRMKNQISNHARPNFQNSLLGFYRLSQGRQILENP